MCCGFKHCRQPPAQPAQPIRLLTRLGDAVPHCIRSLQCWTVTILADCLSYVGSMLATLLPSSPAGCLSWPRPSSQGKQQQEGQLAWGSRARRIRQAQLCRVALYYGQGASGHTVCSRDVVCSSCRDQGLFSARLAEVVYHTGACKCDGQQGQNHSMQCIGACVKVCGPQSWL